MATLDLTIKGGTSVGPLVATADGEPVKLVGKGDTLTGRITTDAEEFTLKVFTYLDIRGPLWFFSSLFYFFVGLFGIFDRIENKKCRCVALTLNVHAEGEKSMLLRMSAPTTDGLAATIESNAGYTVDENRCFIDKKAKKRLKIMRVVKVFAFIGSVAAIAAITVAILSNPSRGV